MGVLAATFAASNLEVGLLVNFGHYPKLEFERIINQRGKRQS